MPREMYLTIETVCFALIEGELQVLLVQRTDDPFSGSWSLPGGQIQVDEPFDSAAQRILSESAGLWGVYLEQLYTFGDPGRDPRGRGVSIAYYALMPAMSVGPAMSNARPGRGLSAAAWRSVDQLPGPLAFDHARIISYARWRLSQKVTYSPLVFHLLPEHFTMSDLRGVYEAIVGEEYDPSNFTRQMLARWDLAPVPGARDRRSRRPARLYRYIGPREINDLRTKLNAVVLAHSYQIPELQDLADFVGDSLGLSRQAAETEADVIVFCGVHFMAETAKILSPEKTVLLPDMNAGCSLAASITADQLREWKAQHPGAVVVSYVNTSAEVKAESDYCCTSANAVQVVQAIPEDTEILFLPDLFLGEWVKRETGRSNIHLWLGECHVHAGIVSEDVDRARIEWPDAELLIHPECACGSKCMLDLQSGRLDRSTARVLSTEGMVRHAMSSDSKQFVVATETGVLHRLRTLAPGKEFRAVRETAVCGFMKVNNLTKVRDSLKHMQHEILVPDDIAVRARVAIDRMVSIG